LADAKANFAELIERAINHGPQYLTENGEDVAVVLSAEDYRNLTEASETA
jgi:prevent-host-death family protein